MPRAGGVDADLRGIEHGDAEDVAIARRAGADDLGEEGDADAHHLARLAALERLLLRLLLRAQLLVVDRLHRLGQGGLIVAGVVFPAHRGRIGKLLAPDQVLHAELGRIHPELLRHDVHGTLDGVRGFGHAERAAIGHAARRLVGIDAVDRDVRGGEVVGPRDDAEQPGRPLGGVGAGVERAVVGDGVAAQRRHLAVLGAGDFRLHVEVARERRGRQVLDAVLDPFHRPPGHDRRDDRADVAGIGADLVAEAAADVGRDDVDLVLGDLRDQRADRADDVRRLERAPERELALDLVEGGDALAGLERAGVHARIDDQLLDGDVGLREGGVGRGLVAGLPVEHVVVVLALAVRALGLVLDVLADDRRVGRHGLERIDVDRQRLVFHLHKISSVGRDVAVLGDDEGDLLVLEQHLAVGEHHLHVAGERRHPRQVHGLERFGGQHRDHARHRRGLRGVDVLDAGMGVRRAREVAVEHVGQLEVVDVVALALDETDVLDALALAAHALQLFGALGRGGGLVVHSAASWNATPPSLAAAY